MATIPVINFHNDKMAQERARVMLRIANGLKSDSSAIIARRMMNPSFKGLPANSTGSRNMPFFAAINEINTPLEAKIAMRPKGMRGSGAMAPTAQQRPLPLGTHTQETDQLDANPNIIAPPFIAPKGGMHGGVLKDFGYAKKILGQRKRDIENQILTEEGLPAQPPELLQLTELQSRKLELAQVLDYYNDQISSGRTDNISILEARNLLRLVVSLSPSFTAEELTELIRIVNNILSDIDELIRDETPTEGQSMRDVNLLASTKTVFETIVEFLEQIGKVANRSLADRVALAKTLVGEIGVPKSASRGLVRGIDQTMGEVVQDVEGIEAREEREDSTLPSVPTEDTMDRMRGSLIDQVETLYDNRDITGLQAMLRQVAPRRRAEKFFRADASRVVLRNAILNAINS